MLCSAWTGARQGGRGLPGRPGAENGGPEIFLQKTLARQGQIRYIHFRAEVVELVDTLGSGSSSGNGVGVRLSPSAPMESKAGRNTSLFLFLGPGSFLPVRDDGRWQAAALPRLFSCPVSSLETEDGGYLPVAGSMETKRRALPVEGRARLLFWRTERELSLIHI